MDERVIGDVQANNLENFWCLFRRSIKRTWICPSGKHVNAYAVDQSFRYKYRKTDGLGRFAVVTAQVVGRRLTWRELVGRWTNSTGHHG